MDNSSLAFITYAGDTLPLVEQLIQALQNQNWKTWVDFKDLEPGQVARGEIERAVQDARWILLLAGPGRFGRLQETECRVALSHAWSDQNKGVLPIVVGKAEVPPAFRSWVPLAIDPAVEQERWTDRVLKILQSGRHETPPSVLAQTRLEQRERLNELGKNIQTDDGAESTQAPVPAKGE